MAGYDWRAGKSNNAVEAERDGLRNATQTARALSARGQGKVSAMAVKKILAPVEWHHASKFFNETLYFRPSAVTDTELEQLVAVTKDHSHKPVTFYSRATVSWTAFYRHRGRWVPGEVTHTGVPVRVVGNRATIHVPGRARPIVKMINSNSWNDLTGRPVKESTYRRSVRKLTKEVEAAAERRRMKSEAELERSRSERDEKLRRRESKRLEMERTARGHAAEQVTSGRLAPADQVVPVAKQERSSFRDADGHVKCCVCERFVGQQNLVSLGGNPGHAHCLSAWIEATKAEQAKGTEANANADAAPHGGAFALLAPEGPASDAPSQGDGIKRVRTLSIDEAQGRAGR